MSAAGLAGPELSFAAEALKAAEGRPAIVRVRAPVVPLETALAHLRRDRLLLWDPPEGPSFAGAGAAATIECAGPDRFESARDAGAALLRSVSVTSEPGLAPFAPRLFGGLAFATGEPAAPWHGFAPADFVLPRWLYGRDAESAWLAVAVAADERAQARSNAAESLELLRRGLERPLPPPPALPARTSLSRPAPERWTRRVEAARTSIAAGRFRKVVLAESALAALEAPADPLSLLARLPREGRFWRFAFRRGTATFLGLSPERLVRLDGRTALADALAGTSASGPGAADLTGRAKDREEHALVVEAIVEALSRFGRVDAPAEPRALPLKHLVHLHTPVTAQLARGAHVLDLAAALHPTPAVGGTPRASALEWIAMTEEPRGWYAGPVGWFDAEGNGELAVAIRSALLDGTRAHVWAGAGIVRASRADEERAEVLLKQQSMLGALLGGVP